MFLLHSKPSILAISSLIRPAVASFIPNRRCHLNYPAFGKNKKATAVRINITCANIKGGLGTVSLVDDGKRAIRGAYTSRRVGGRQSALDFMAFFLQSP